MRETVRERNTQETQAKNAKQQQFLVLAEVELPDGRQRQHEDGDIGDDVAGRVDIPLRDVGDAGRVGRRVPEAADGRADEDADQQLRQRPAADDDDGDDVDDAHVLHGQDAVILEQKGHLHGEQRCAVEDDGEVEILPGDTARVRGAASKRVSERLFFTHPKIERNVG